MLGGHVVDQLLNQHRFADARAAEQADLAALGVRLKQVDDLDARLENLHGGALLLKGGRLAVDAALGGIGRHVVAAVDRLAEDVEHAPERRLADGHLNRAPRGAHSHAAGETVAPGEHDAAHGVLADMLGDLHHALDAITLDGERLFHLRQMPGLELDVHNGAGDLHDGSCFQFAHASFLCLRRCALAPAEISVISCVMPA